jgi:hypothetical protein
MSTFKLEIDLGNDAMKSAADVSRALKELSYKLEGYEDSKDFSGVIMDDNGNKVGRYEVD